MNAIMCKHGDMTLVDFDDRFAFSCHGCHQMGYGTCYHCGDGCDYQLHQECQTASPEARFSFFGHKQFIRKHQLLCKDTEALCTACGVGVNGLMYVCALPSGNVFLHPCCMKLPHRIDIDDNECNRFTLKRKLVYLACQYCESTTLEGRIAGWAYVSADQKSACHVKCMKDRLYIDWLMYVQQEENQKANQGPWWLNAIYDDGADPPDGSSSSSSSSYPSTPLVSIYGHQPNQEQNSVAITKPPPKGRKRRIFWKLTVAAVKLFINVAVGDPISTIMTVHDLLC